MLKLLTTVVATYIHLTSPHQIRRDETGASAAEYALLIAAGVTVGGAIVLALTNFVDLNLAKLL